MDLRNAVWVKAARSSVSGDNCVEVALNLPQVAIRDSKHPDGHVIVLGRATWRGITSKMRLEA